jgi:pimeloyl-ACP methyl ester carboxylesterase
MTMEDLADIRTVYAIDLPGYGKSPPLAEPTSAERLAECVIEFADKLQIEQFDLNGHSFGAAVAVYMAARYPERIQQMVLSSFGMFGTELMQLWVNQVYMLTYMPLQFWHPWLGFLQPWMTTWQLSMLAAGNAPIVPWSMARPFFFHMPADPVLIQEGYNEFMLMDPRTSLENTMSLGNPLLRVSMEQIQAPTLLVAGRQDMIVPSPYIEAAAKIIPNCRTAWIDQCGHIPMIEQRAAYQRALHAFLAGTTRVANIDQAA